MLKVQSPSKKLLCSDAPLAVVCIVVIANPKILMIGNERDEWRK